MVITFPVDAGAGIRTLESLTLWEQLGLAALLQRHWADNQVSCTVSFNPETEHAQIAPALDLYQYQLKGVSSEWAVAVGPLLCVPTGDGSFLLQCSPVSNLALTRKCHTRLSLKKCSENT